MGTEGKRVSTAARNSFTAQSSPGPAPKSINHNIQGIWNGQWESHFGLSEAGAQTIRRAHAVQPVAA
jgi:hypothetical protein